MTAIISFDDLEQLGRERLSPNFFMRDFLYSEIAAWNGMRNFPDYPDRAIAVGKRLCEELLEPLQATFGRIHIRSGYRSPTVNRFGNEHKLNCASNEANYGVHIWDYADPDGYYGATACIVIPWLVDHISRGGHWTDMAWWIHDNLPYSTMTFFSKLAAFNIGWHEKPLRRIDSYAAPRGCLTRVGMSNHGGSHNDQYVGFPTLSADRSERPPLIQRKQDGEGVSDSASDCVEPKRISSTVVPSSESTALQFAASPAQDVRPASVHLQDIGGPVHYRAIHTRTQWRKVNSHNSLEAAIYGKDGAAGLFAGKVRIDYAKHGDPLYVLVWQSGAPNGYVIKPDPSAPRCLTQAAVPISDLLDFDAREHVSHQEIERYFG